MQLQAEQDSGVQPEHGYTVASRLSEPTHRAQRGRAGGHPKGQPGRPSKALTAGQAAAVLKAVGESRLGAYVVLCLMTGIRTEEARALRWKHVKPGRREHRGVAVCSSRR
jgi:integrase